MLATKEEINTILNNKISYVEQKYGTELKLLIIEILTLERSMHEAKPETRFIQPIDWNKYHDRPTLSALRNLITRRKINGFEEVLHKDGKLWYIDEQKYFDWKRKRFRKTAEEQAECL